MADCKWVDEEIIELHAMGRIEDGFVREHLDYCISCTVSLAESRVWIGTLRRGLRILQEASDHHEEANDDNSNQQEGS